MKLSLVNGERREAEKGLLGNCIGCGQLTIPKCGDIKIWHWAHKSSCECDHWWENETQWHRDWKNHFPKECQEIRHKDESTGEWHISDVRTKMGYFIEFQHSFLKPDERQSRNKFYGEKLLWVVDGTRKTKDRPQFDLILKNTKLVNQNFKLGRLPSAIESCPFLKEWTECSIPVFFDFNVDVLWCILPRSSKGFFYVLPFPKKDFIALHNGAVTQNRQNFTDVINLLNDLIFAIENPEIIEAMRQKQANDLSVQRNASQTGIRHSFMNVNELRWLQRQISPHSQQRQYNNNRRFKKRW